jgi:hypothetical protein
MQTLMRAHLIAPVLKKAESDWIIRHPLRTTPKGAVPDTLAAPPSKKRPLPDAAGTSTYSAPRQNRSKHARIKKQNGVSGDTGLQIEQNHDEPLPPFGSRLIANVIGRSTLSIWQEGKWRKKQPSHHGDVISASELKWCLDVDRVRTRLAQFGARDGHTAQTSCRLHPTTEDAPPAVWCAGLELNGLKSSAPPAALSPFWRAHQKALNGVKLVPREKPLVHLFIAQEESMVIPFLYGLDFVTVGSVMPGDFVFTIDNRVVSVWERKREDDLMGSIGKRLIDQRSRLKEVAIPAHRITILQEALWRTKNSQWAPDDYQMGGCAANAVQRDGFRWCYTTSMMHTVFTVLRTILSLVEKGSHFDAWQDSTASLERGTQLTSVCQRVSDSGADEATEQMSSYIPPLPDFGRAVQAQVARHSTHSQSSSGQNESAGDWGHTGDVGKQSNTARGGRPRQHATKNNNWVRIISCVPGVGLTSAIGVANRYRSCQQLMRAYEACANEDARQTMLCDVRAVVLLKSDHVVDKDAGVVEGPKLGKSKSRNICAQFWDGSDQDGS